MDHSTSHGATRSAPVFPARSQDGLLTRLRRDRGGNTLAMMGAFLIPICGLAGSAVDMARLYVVKVRLQQACDAGVLAGRKFMTSSNDVNLDSNATSKAKTFFANNFTSGWMGTPVYSSTTNPYPFTPRKTSDQQVAGTATTTVPMTIMKMFGSADQRLTVTCEARFDVADTDVMFVLDTTGSMSCPTTGCNTAANYFPYVKEDGTTGYAANELTNAKIRGLRTAVLNFYDTMITNADPTTNIRYGFVPYSTTVNVGRLLRPEWFVETASYASRVLDGEVNSGNQSNVTLTGYTSTTCSSANGRYPGPDPMAREDWTTSSTAYYISNAAWTSNKCAAKRQNVVPVWRYTSVPYDVRGYLRGDTIVDPTKLTGETVAAWNGCIEERTSSPDATFDFENLPGDLDPDLPPDTEARRWRPQWPAVVYDRDQSSDLRTSANKRNLGTTGSLQGGLAPCGKQAQRLTVMTRAQVETYLSATGDFRPYGNTYHDTGMIWGTRLLSPRGPFANDTAAWPGRNEPNRHLIFMTDGETATNTDINSLYGVEQNDLRVTGGSLSQLTARHNARFVAECQAARARNITVWVVSFGQALNAHLKACATQDNAHIFYARDEAQLDAAFRKIAEQIAKLRLSK